MKYLVETRKGGTEKALFSNEYHAKMFLKSVENENAVMTGLRTELVTDYKGSIIGYYVTDNGVGVFAMDGTFIGKKDKGQSIQEWYDNVNEEVMIPLF